LCISTETVKEGQREQLNILESVSETLTRTLCEVSAKLNKLTGGNKYQFDSRTNIDCKGVEIEGKNEHNVSHIAEPKRFSPVNRANVNMDNSCDVIEESIERERRKNNIIVHNIPEQDDIEQDIKFVEEVAGEVGVNIAISKAIRLGEKTANRNRLLLVKVQDLESRHSLLKAARLLKSSQKYANIYISPDLSPTERARNRQLRQELKERREKGEEHLVIRGGAVVHAPPPGRNRTHF